MKRILILSICFDLVISPLFAMGNKEGGTVAGVAAGGVAGTATGAGVGAGVGAVIGSIVPGAGTAIGAVFGAKIGGLIGAFAGGTSGGIIGNGLSGSGTEYVYVSTNFVIAQAGNNDFHTAVTPNASIEGNYNVPEYSFGKDIYLTIEMQPSLIEDAASRVSNAMKSTSVDIPVTLIIDNTDSIEVTNSGGIYLEEIETDVEGISYASFTIKLNPSRTYPVTFKISPAQIGTSRFTVIYGTDDNPLVSLDSNRTFLIDFVEPADEE